MNPEGLRQPGQGSADVVRDELAVPGGGRMPVHIWRPQGAGPWPALVLLPEIFGITPAIRDAARRAMEMGYIVAVPDLHYRSEPDTVLDEDEAGRQRGLTLLRAMTRPAVLSDLSCLHAHLMERRDCTGSVSVIGFSAGGPAAYLAATAMAFRALVVLYGGWIGTAGIPLSQPEPPVAATAGMKGRVGQVLYVVGSEDHLIGAEERDNVGAALAQAGIDHEMVVLDGVGHGFMVPNRATSDDRAAALTWAKIGEVLAAAHA
jgi:carboxymethylenebutenolidase